MSKRSRAIAPAAIVAALSASPTSTRTHGPVRTKKTATEKPKKKTVLDRARLWAAKEKRERKAARRREARA